LAVEAAGVEAAAPPLVGPHMPPEAVEWSSATEQPDATEPLSATESPELTELLVAWPKPEHTDEASATQLPDSFGVIAEEAGAAAGAAGAAVALAFEALCILAASAGAVSTMLAAVTRPVTAARQPTPATRILLIFMNVSLCSSLLVACFTRYPLRTYAVASSRRPKPANATRSAPRAIARAPAKLSCSVSRPVKASAGPEAAWAEGIDDDPLPPFDGWQVPPDEVEWSMATEQPEATEPCMATASPDDTELSRAVPEPDATEVSSAFAVPDAVGFAGPPAGGAATTLLLVPVFAAPVFPPPLELPVELD